MKAIVLNGSSRNSLAIIRSLANQNFLIDTVVYIFQMIIQLILTI